jgi:hypothetical protein
LTTAPRSAYRDTTEGASKETVMVSVRQTLRGLRERRASHRPEQAAAGAERAQRRAQAEALRLKHKRYTTLGGGGGGGGG